MARFVSSLALFSGLMTLMQATAQDVTAQGQGFDLEDRSGTEWSYIPNYGYESCNSYYTDSLDADKFIEYDAGGAKGSVLDGFGSVSCCGNSSDLSAATIGAQACGPEFWPFVSRNAFYRCQSSNAALSATPKNNQQTPINIQTVPTFGNTQLSFKDISEVPPVYPTTTGRAATGFDFSKTPDRTPKFSFKACEGSISKTLNKGTGTFQVNFPTSCDLSMTIGTKKFKLLQWHIHSSEHTVNGLFHPLELHMVHQEMDSTGALVPNSLAVAATFLTVGGGPNSVLAGLIKDDEAGKTTTLTLPYRMLHSVKRSYWHYLGSLTTPPCQAADDSYVRWFIFKKPLLISSAQASYFGSFLNVVGKSYNGQNNRPVQPVLDTTQIYSYGK